MSGAREIETTDEICQGGETSDFGTMEFIL